MLETQSELRNTIGKVVDTTEDMEHNYRNLVKKISQEQRRIKQMLTKSHKVRSVLIVATTILSTVLLLMIVKDNNTSEIYDFKTLESTVLGANDKKELKDISEFQEHLVSVFNGFNQLQNKIFQQYVPQESLFYFKNFQSTNSKSSNEIMTTDLTQKLKGATEEQLSQKAISSNLGLPFEINNLESIKKFINNVHQISIEAKEIVLLSLNGENSAECRKWNVSITYSQIDPNPFYTATSDLNYEKCNPDDFESPLDNSAKTHSLGTIKISEMFLFNVLSFIANVFLLVYILNVVVDIAKYKLLTTEKDNKRKWLVRNN